VLDDSAAGPGCLATLRRMPFSAVKLRGEIVHRATHSAPHRASIETLVQAAHGLDREVYACAVEDPATLELLVRLGVDHAQGNYLAQPAAR
jgi:EAL domain-containing protein (putative c-di-GMP-specific phosphodiesterase class I)